MSDIYIMRQTYKSFALTIRPRLGITDATIEAYLSWLRKQAYAVAVLEMADEARHLHAQIWIEEGRTKDDVAKQVKRICERTIEDWDAGQSKVLRSGIRIAYSDWYLEYLTDNEEKGEANIIINKPPDKTESYYPTEEEQEQVKAVSQSADPRFTKMEQECNEYLGKNNLNLSIKSVARYLANSMFVERTMKVLVQQRDRTAICKTLFAYMSKSGDIDLFVEKTHQEKKEEQKFEKLKEYINNNLPPDSETDDEEFS